LLHVPPITFTAVFWIGPPLRLFSRTWVSVQISGHRSFLFSADSPPHIIAFIVSLIDVSGQSNIVTLVSVPALLHCLIVVRPITVVRGSFRIRPMVTRLFDSFLSVQLSECLPIVVLPTPHPNIVALAALVVLIFILSHSHIVTFETLLVSLFGIIIIHLSGLLPIPSPHTRGWQMSSA
ncbi:hypothetical protein PMAYCL1PPCAC_32233, partial [Pristionchus mayeri]